METKEIIGEVQTIKSDRKSLAIQNVWYNNFSLLPEDLKKGDSIKITYLTKETNGRTFNNIKRIEPVIQKNTPETQEIPNQTQNTIIMSVTNIICKSMEEGKNYTEEEMTKVIMKLTNDFKSSFELL